MQPGDGEQVTRPGLEEVLAHVVREVAAEAEQHGLGQRGVGLGQAVLQRVGEPVPERVHSAQRPRAPPLVDQRGAGEGHDRRDALARQVLPIVEVVEARRRLEAALEAQDVAVAEVGGVALADKRRVGTQRDQDAVGERGVGVGGGGARRDLQPVGGAGFAGVAHDLGFEGDVLRRQRV